MVEGFVKMNKNIPLSHLSFKTDRSLKKTKLRNITFFIKQLEILFIFCQ